MPFKQNFRAMTFPRIGKLIILFFALAFLIAGARAYQLYRFVFESNVQKEYSILIKPDTPYDSIYHQLKTDQVLKDIRAFRWVAKKKKYPDNIKAGYYTFQKGMSANQVVNKLLSGTQAPIQVSFHNVRFKEELAGKVSKRILADSLSIVRLFENDSLISAWGFTRENFRTMFIPNTYEMYWTTNALQFAQRMKKEYDRFWNATRREQAQKAGLTPQEVIILASIVESETSKADEMKTVAGLYLNRLRKNILLQADPTIKYALGDYSIRRVLDEHLLLDSPYNTYKYPGLPPGPICFPEITSIEAVLNFEQHDYLFMCAKDDFSGYHNFARNLREHNRNARKYQKALNQRKIFK